MRRSALSVQTITVGVAGERIYRMGDGEFLLIYLVHSDRKVATTVKSLQLHIEKLIGRLDECHGRDSIIYEALEVECSILLRVAILSMSEESGVENPP